MKAALLAAYISIGMSTAAFMDQLYRSSDWEPKAPGFYLATVGLWPFVHVSVFIHSMIDSDFLEGRE